MKAIKLSALALLLSMGATVAFAQTKSKKTKAKAKTEHSVEVGGAKMLASKNIIENASQSADHTTLVTAVNAAGLAETLQGEGPFTVFAPTNEAFDMAGKNTIAALTKPEYKDLLTGVLNYHVVQGKYTAKDLLKLIEDNGGKAELTTVQGGKLTAEKKGTRIALVDERGVTAFVTIKDVEQSNGVVHVVDRVLMPNQDMSKLKI